jgi:hypothetical protein
MSRTISFRQLAAAIDSIAYPYGSAEGSPMQELFHIGKHLKILWQYDNRIDNAQEGLVRFTEQSIPLYRRSRTISLTNCVVATAGWLNTQSREVAPISNRYACLGRDDLEDDLNDVRARRDQIYNGIINSVLNIAAFRCSKPADDVEMLNIMAMNSIHVLHFLRYFTGKGRFVGTRLITAFTTLANYDMMSIDHRYIFEGISRTHEWFKSFLHENSKIIDFQHVREFILFTHVLFTTVAYGKCSQNEFPTTSWLTGSVFNMRYILSRSLADMVERTLSQSAIVPIQLGTMRDTIVSDVVAVVDALPYLLWSSPTELWQGIYWVCFRDVLREGKHAHDSSACIYGYTSLFAMIHKFCYVSRSVLRRSLSERVPTRDETMDDVRSRYVNSIRIAITYSIAFDVDEIPESIIDEFATNSNVNRGDLTEFSLDVIDCLSGQLRADSGKL